MRRLFYPLFICCVLVIVYPDRVFSQKRTRAVRGPSVTFDTKPINLDLDQLPPNYIGNSYFDILLAILKRQKFAVKGEFESTIDFKARMQRADSQPFLGSINFKSLLAFTFVPDDGQLTLKYDADLTTLDVNFKWDRFYGTGDYQNPVYKLTWSERSRQIGAYVGRNAFNMRKRVQVYRNDDFLLGARGDDLNRAGLLDIKTSFFMPPSEAKIAKGNLRALVIGHLAERPLYRDNNRDTPEMTDPYDRYNFTYVLIMVPEEVWFYDYPTGKIYARLPFDEAESELPSSNNSIPETTTSDKLKRAPGGLPRIISRPEPKYTIEANKKQIAGTVILQALFTADGQVTNIEVIKGLPEGLTESAIEAAKQIKFVPAQSNGTPISKKMKIEYEFNLY